MGISQRMGEMKKGFADLVEKVVSARGYFRIQLFVETLPARLALIAAIKEYQGSGPKQMATAREIVLLRAHVRQHLSSSVLWEEVYAAVYVDPDRLFPLELKG